MNESHRADIVTARESLRRAAAGFDDVDYAAAASMLDRVLKNTCPHNARDAWTQTHDASGRTVTTCTSCNVSWVEPE